ncbi:MAG: 23S rRNA (uracil(1939)-C(5))-methyltransferase RlmD, partial [Ruminiclostridium sp.]|nr:23S rRNA (uracil(1939)-C(5))-methyltransferase RlmD [Ruminiclostridium sp.]
VTVDPARKGCDTTTLDNILAFSPERVVMISCNPATAARDCKYLSEHGYGVISVRGVDMFPRTVHVECVILLNKQL